MKVRFSALEARVDKDFESISIGKVDRRILISLLMVSLNEVYLQNINLFHAQISRFAYLVPLIKKTSHDLQKLSFSIFSQALTSHHLDVINLITYGQFCEVAPSFWRNYFIANFANSDTELSLSYKSVEFEAWEEFELIITNLSAPRYRVKEALKVKLQEVVEQVKLESIQLLEKRALNLGEMIRLSRLLVDLHIENSSEVLILQEGKFKNAFNLTFSEYLRIKSSLIAFCDVLSARIAYFTIEWRKSESSKTYVDFIRSVSYELDYKILVEIIKKISNSSDDTIVNFLKFLTFKIDDDKVFDDFVPPLLYSSNKIWLYPPMVKASLTLRNFLFVLKNSQKEVFDELVSSNFEPQLIDQAVSFISRCAGLIIKRNLAFPSGEVDLVVFNQVENTCLMIQVKATLTPTTARSVERIEGRIIEAQGQLQTFRSLGEDLKIEFFRNHFGLDNVPFLVDVVLARSNFGTLDVINRYDAVYLNFILLVKWVSENKDNPSLLNFKEAVETIRNEIIRECKLEPEVSTMKVFGNQISFPSLNFNQEKIEEYFNEIHDLYAGIDRAI